MSGFKWLPTMLASFGIRVVFTLSKLLPVNRNKITFASYRSEKLKDNLMFVYEEWKARGGNETTIFLLKTYRPGLLGKLDYFLHMIKASYHLATSRFFIVDDYYFPIYVIKPRNGTDIVQLWHAAGAFKKFGYSTINKSFGPSEDYLKRVKVHSNYTKVMVSGSEVIPFYAEAFNMPEDRILPLGVPRTDYFYNGTVLEETTASFYQHYPELLNKTLILYAPTFRGKSHDQEVFHIPMDLAALKKEIGDQYAFLIHLHPYMRKGIAQDAGLEGFVYLMDGQYNIQELLGLTDLLVTDYSSIIFDFSLRDQPMVFFAHDLDDYELERGFYYEFRSFIPGPLFEETESFIEWLKMGDFDTSKVKSFKEKFFDYTDGQASRRIVDYLIQIK